MLVPPVPTHLYVGGVHRHQRLVMLVFVVLIGLIGLMVVLDEFVCVLSVPPILCGRCYGDTEQPACWCYF